MEMLLLVKPKAAVSEVLDEGCTTAEFLQLCDVDLQALHVLLYGAHYNTIFQKYSHLEVLLLAKNGS